MVGGASRRPASLTPAPMAPPSMPFTTPGVEGNGMMFVMPGQMVAPSGGLGFAGVPTLPAASMPAVSVSLPPAAFAVPTLPASVLQPPALGSPTMGLTTTVTMPPVLARPAVPGFAALSMPTTMPAPMMASPVAQVPMAMPPFVASMPGSMPAALPGATVPVAAHGWGDGLALWHRRSHPGVRPTSALLRPGTLGARRLITRRVARRRPGVRVVGRVHGRPLQRIGGKFMDPSVEGLYDMLDLGDTEFADDGLDVVEGDEIVRIDGLEAPTAPMPVLPSSALTVGAGNTLADVGLTTVAGQRSPRSASPPVLVTRGRDDVAERRLRVVSEERRQTETLAALTPAPPATLAPVPPILVWRCRHPHGFFSMFSLAMGHMLTCEQKGWTLVVDWSWEELLYKGPPGEPNLWNAFFHQPAEMACARDVLERALARGQYMETEKHDVVYGALKGVVQGYGSIPAHQAAQGRALVRKHVALRESFAQRLRSAMDSLLGGNRRWLAVHIRRGDKAIEAKANFELTDEDILLRIIAQCSAWRCNGVFLCTDDPSLKDRLKTQLETGIELGGPGLSVSIFPSTLSSVAGQGTHFDKSLDSYRTAEDVMFEAMLMARGCHGLLSTFSNVSASVVYLSPTGFPYTSFWDPVEPLAVGQADECVAATQLVRRPAALPVRCSDEVTTAHPALLFGGLGIAR